MQKYSTTAPTNGIGSERAPDEVPTTPTREAPHPFRKRSSVAKQGNIGSLFTKVLHSIDEVASLFDDDDDDDAVASPPPALPETVPRLSLAPETMQIRKRSSASPTQTYSILSLTTDFTEPGDDPYSEAHNGRARMSIAPRPSFSVVRMPSSKLPSKLSSKQSISALSSQTSKLPSVATMASMQFVSSAIVHASISEPVTMELDTEAVLSASTTTERDLAKLTEPSVKKWPIFLIVVSFVQVVMFVVEIIMNGRWTGSPIQTRPFNYMIGPDSEVSDFIVFVPKFHDDQTLVRLGARFVPCMKSPSVLTGKQISCHSGMCSLNELCDMDSGFSPNQWWRFITPLFLHTGLVHLMLNIVIQGIYGWGMEVQIKSWRLTIIYFTSGFFGFAVGGSYGMQNSPSVGSSGAMLGLLGARFSDLLLNWKSKQSPTANLVFFLLDLSINLALGLFVIPGVDNFAHIGGLLMGVLLGMALVPAETTSTKIRSIIQFCARMFALLCAMVLLAGVVAGFYLGDADALCPGCRRLACVPTLINQCRIDN